MNNKRSASCRMWSVQAYTRENQKIEIGGLFIPADSELEAMALGATAVRLMGVLEPHNVRVASCHFCDDLEFDGPFQEAAE